MSSGLNRKRYTSDQKKLIIQIKEENLALSYGEVAEEFYRLTKTKISESSVYNFWRNRESIKKGIPYSTRQPIDVSISEETILKVEEAEKKDKEVTESDVIEFAQKVVREHRLNPEQYFFSPEWARGILRGKRDDVSIQKSRSSKPETPKQIPASTSTSTSSPTSGLTPTELPDSGTSRLLCPSPNQNIVFIEENSQGILDSSHVATNTSELVLNDRISSTQPVKREQRKRSDVPPRKRATRNGKAVQVNPSPAKKIKVEEDGSPEESASLREMLIAHSNGHDYRFVLYSLLEEAYRDSLYFGVGMEKELESIKRTLQFMVEKEGRTW